MATLVTDRFVEEQIRAQRMAWGSDRYDEVWEGTYLMTPLPNIEHQGLVQRLTSILDSVVGVPGLGDEFPGTNVSDHESGWEHNYRCPDVVVVMKGSRAKDCGTHFYGGPDFLAEIVSPDDRSRDKFEFYGKIGVGELIIIDRDPWSLELYQLQGEELKLVGESQLEEPALLTSAVVPLSFRLIPGEARPQIEATHRDEVQRWVV